ncbi:MAG: redoxin domain-containing protein [Spirochaetes bacterium]|nr:redoxin domain-containing protein [Spirochaetota bacterium]
MKKAIFIIFILTILISNIFSDEKELIQEAYKYIGKKKYNHVIDLAEKGIKDFGETENLLYIKIIGLLGLKKGELALTFVEDSIEKFGETKRILELKYRALLLQKKYKEALDTSVKIEKTSKQKNYRDCINIAVAYTNLGDKEKALNWLEEAVNRGFISLNNLYGDYFITLKNEDRYNKIIEKIKDKINIGKKSKDFTIKLFSGEKFILSKQKGKVILLYFWAVNCGSCENEMPNLQEYYNEFKNDGFEIIGISLDKNEEELKDYIEKKNIKWKISFSNKGFNDDTRKLYEVSFIPSYWLIDKKGVLRYFDLRGEKLRKAISELILEK